MRAKSTRSLKKGPRETIAQRKALFEQLKMANLKIADFNFLTANGIIDLAELPDGLRVVILPDIHAPAEHKQIMWAVKQFLADYKPHILILIGDAGDVFGLSAWPVSPRIPSDLQHEVEATRELIDELVDVSECMHCFITMGNHEDRVRRWLANFGQKLQRLVGMESREPMLSFHEMMGYKPGGKVTFIYDLQGGGGFGGALRLADLKFLHGLICRPKPGASPRAMTEVDQTSVFHGHTHRAGGVFRRTTTNVLRSYEGGYLADPARSEMAYANMLNNWHHLISKGLVVGGKLHINLLPIIQIKTSTDRHRYMFVADGKPYYSSDR